MSDVHVLIISDTHLTTGARLPTALLELAGRADHILHAGDVTDPDVLDVLEAFAALDVVRGNCDGFDLFDRAPEWTVVELGGVRIGMVHDGGARAGRHARLRERFGPDVSVVVYGHSHLPEIERAADQLLVINPGSPTQRRRAPFHSVVWMEIEAGAVVDAQLINLDEA
jgi:putative phosphoesterase